jgi:hypothetical protein
MVMDAREYGGEGPALKPVLASIPNSLKYMGGISRAKFYADVLPLLETVKIGSRNLVVVESMNRLIASLLSPPADVPATDARAEPHGMAAAVRATAERVRAQREPPGAAVHRRTGRADPPRDQ